MTFKCNGRAAESDLKSLEKLFLRNPPLDYFEFLRRCDGGEGFVGEEYFILWRAAEIEPFNKEYEVAEYLSDVLLFGSNGGGEAYGFRKTQREWEVVRVPFVGMAPELVEKVADSISQLMGSLPE